MYNPITVKSMTNNTADILLINLQRKLRSLGPVAVAVSGGVDSMTLATVAHRINAQSEMFHAVSAAVPAAATTRVNRYAQQKGWRLSIIDANEMADEEYRRNPINRCYFCKTNLYSTLKKFSALPIVSGTNLDDLKDFRPGLQAANENGVAHPYVDAGIDKANVRAIAQYLHLTDLQELPASPCLSSRITTGIAIDEKLLPVIDAVETQIWEQFGLQLALSTVRCRVLPTRISIQLQGEVDFANETDHFVLIKLLVKQIFSEAGYRHFHQVSVEPYEKGSAFVRAVNL